MIDHKSLMVPASESSQVRHVDGQLDRLQISFAFSSTPSVGGSLHVEGLASVEVEDGRPRRTSPRTQRLRAIVKTLSTTSSPKALLDATHISSLLSQFDQLSLDTGSSANDQVGALKEEELQWLLVGKAAAQTYGVMLKTLLEQTIPLSDDIWYWSEVLGSYQRTVLYSAQMSPLHFWNWCENIYADSRRRLMSLQDSRSESITAESGREGNDETSITQSWRRFYDMVKESIRARSIPTLPATVLSPFALSRADAKAKQDGLRRLREMSAAGLGVLMNECLRFDVDEDGNIVRRGDSEDSQANGGKEEWKSIVEKSIALMETVMKSVTMLEMGVSDFEEAVFASVDDESAIVEPSVSSEERPLSRQALLSKRLKLILDAHLPEHLLASRRLVKRYGRPSIWIRYWLPATILLAFSGTILRVVSQRKAAIIDWIREAGETALDFWSNWVVEPLRKVIGTIRHDQDSEVALMSKKSLEGDRASLERMVVDFAIDRSGTDTGGPLSETDIASIQSKVKEGDLTPVLRAYERDLRRPFMGTVRGDLIRALLIQIQKTKVDVEVAISGIDSLLKSQELVFG